MPVFKFIPLIQIYINTLTHSLTYICTFGSETPAQDRMSNLQFKKNDLYVYDLPHDLLNSLKLIHFDATIKEVDQPAPKNDNTQQQQQQNKASHGALNNKPLLHCNACDIDFRDQIEQRKHYQSNFHSFNIKNKIKGASPITLLDFQKLSSKSETEILPQNTEKDHSEESDIEEESSSSSDNDDYELLPKILSKMNIDETNKTISHLNTQSPYIFFNSNLLPHEEINNNDSNAKQVFGAYKVLFNEQELQFPSHSIREWNDVVDQSTNISALFMVGGGHFAGAIICHQRKNVNGNARKQNETFQEQAITFLEHKTFHRYTTRRKQGGSQSAMDNAKGNANSAGSTLRRYNEAALKLDVQNLLTEWEPYLAKCENIYIRARSVFDKRMFFENNMINKNDSRLKTFPFTTGRPTVHELKRAWCELTYLKITSKPAPIVLKKLPVVATKNKTKIETKEELTPEEKYSEEMVQLVKKGRAPLLISYMRKNKLDVNFILKPDSKYINTPTLLHYAAQQGLKQMVIILLSNMKADPTITNHIGKTAWDLNKTAPIKQSFQIARHNLGEGYTNWEESHIDQPLSREAVDEINKNAKEEESKEDEKLVQKELQAVKERLQSEKDAKRGKGNKLDSDSGISMDQNLNSLSDEQRRRIMREQRARAAEARMRQNK